MVTRPRLPSKGLTLSNPRNGQGCSLVMPLNGNALISTLLSIKTMFLIVSLAVQLTSSLVHIIYISFFHFFYHFKVNHCRRKLYTAKSPNLKTRKIILFQDSKSCFRIYNLGSIARKLSRQDCDNLENKIQNLENKNQNLENKI